jgi:adenylyltransferase/sulfurtransferase
MDPAVYPAALEAAERAGERHVAIVHSHPDVGAYFSEEDRKMALGGGESPLWPDVDYLVVSCKAGGVDDARLYRWDPGTSDFAETEITDISRL